MTANEDAHEVDPAVVLYEALHDATCSEHGAHCEEFRAQVTDACRVALWRLEESGYTVVAATRASGPDDIVVSRDLAQRLLRSAEANGYTYRHELRAALSQPHPAQEQQ